MVLTEDCRTGRRGAVTGDHRALIVKPQVCYRARGLGITRRSAAALLRSSPGAGAAWRRHQAHRDIFRPEVARRARRSAVGMTATSGARCAREASSAGRTAVVLPSSGEGACLSYGVGGISSASASAGVRALMLVAARVRCWSSSVTKVVPNWRATATYTASAPRRR